MAHHQQSNHDRMIAAQGLTSNSLQGSTGTPPSGDDELASDVDEPPDEQIQFKKMNTLRARSSKSNGWQPPLASPALARDRKESLLTQALLSSPELNPILDTETPMLTSDGGLTSPARTTTPSPPLSTFGANPAVGVPKDYKSNASNHSSEALQIASGINSDSSRKTDVEAGLGRKRCISFACGRQSTPQNGSNTSTKMQAATENPTTVAAPAKRPCMLKFVCPIKPSRTDSRKDTNNKKSSSPPQQVTPPSEIKIVCETPATDAQISRKSVSNVESDQSQNVPPCPVAIQSRKGRSFNRVDFQKSEATRFFEFGCQFSAEDEWTNEQTAFRQKITVNDTLRKENAIRKLAEEAEEEVLDEEGRDGAATDEDEEDEDEEEDNLNHDGHNILSDDGNESDDEEGFADSDDESDDGSDYQFWTPGLTTAATSTEHIEHIRPAVHRVASDSSIGSAINMKNGHGDRTREGSVTQSPKLDPNPSSLPDTSEFVVGTVDEDRYLEEAYLSCLEERRRSKHHLLPQDIDPSFPTSEPDADNDDEEDNEDIDVSSLGNASERVKPHLDSSGNEALPHQSQDLMPSPPPKKISAHRSPPPRRLFGQCTHRLRSPPPMHRKLISPPSSRRPSLSGSPCRIVLGVDMPHLAQRPNLTHTRSLPKTPNPFWDQHRRSRFQGIEPPSTSTSPKTVNSRRPNSHSRGPIDIVQGLEAKRQRRKDKFWRQHCRMAGKEKHRRCQPGKGAERMKELGLEMADRCRGYGQKAQLVLSI